MARPTHKTHKPEEEPPKEQVVPAEASQEALQKQKTDNQQLDTEKTKSEQEEQQKQKHEQGRLPENQTRTQSRLAERKKITSARQLKPVSKTSRILEDTRLDKEFIETIDRNCRNHLFQVIHQAERQISRIDETEQATNLKAPDLVDTRVILQDRPDEQPAQTAQTTEQTTERIDEPCTETYSSLVEINVQIEKFEKLDEFNRPAIDEHLFNPVWQTVEELDYHKDPLVSQFAERQLREDQRIENLVEKDQEVKDQEKPASIDYRHALIHEYEELNRHRDPHDRLSLANYALVPTIEARQIEEEPQQFRCLLPSDIACRLAEIGPLEPEALKYLHDEYGFRQRSDSVKDEQSKEREQASFTASKMHAVETPMQKLSEVSSGRLERAASQIEQLEALKPEDKTFGEAEFVEISYVAKEKDACYELQNSTSSAPEGNLNRKGSESKPSQEEHETGREQDDELSNTNDAVVESETKSRKEHQEQQFHCYVPAAVALKLCEIGSLEPETLNYLHDEYAYIERYMSGQGEHELETIQAGSFASAAHHAREAMTPLRNQVCPNRGERGELQIQQLAMHANENNLLAQHGYVEIIYAANSKEASYAMKHTAPVAWEAELPETLKKVLSERDDGNLKEELEQLGRRLGLTGQKQDRGLDSRRTIHPIDRDSKLLELDMEHEKNEEPQESVTVYIIKKSRIDRIYSARNMEELERYDPHIPIDPELLAIVLHLDHNWKLWEQRKERAQSRFDDSRRAQRAEYDHDQDHDDLGR